jgi:hypothetical protein
MFKSFSKPTKKGESGNRPGDWSASLKHPLIDHRNSNTPLSEQNIWRIFYCFVQGLCSMDHGTEFPDPEEGENPQGYCRHTDQEGV